MPEQGALDHVAAQCWNGAVNAAGKDSIYVKGSRQGKERFSVAKKIDSFGQRDMDICAFTCIEKNI
jgi:hypothetical protein